MHPSYFSGQSACFAMLSWIRTFAIVLYTDCINRYTSKLLWLQSHLTLYYNYSNVCWKRSTMFYCCQEATRMNLRPRPRGDWPLMILRLRKIRRYSRQEFDEGHMFAWGAILTTHMTTLNSNRNGPRPPCYSYPHLMQITEKVQVLIESSFNMSLSINDFSRVEVLVQ